MFRLLILAAETWRSSSEGSPSLLVAMLARDEEPLLKRHLPQWRDIGDCFIFGFDSRTQDASQDLVEELLAPKAVQAYLFEFSGFGNAKTELLRRSYETFPNIDYVLLAEPDMHPGQTTFDRAILQSRDIVYSVRRSGKESRGVRLADTVFLNDGRWKFKFRMHETPVYKPAEGESGVPEKIKDTGWSVVEVEGSSRDGQTRLNRLREELRLVELDLAEFPGHPRLSYYVGVLHFEVAMELQSVPEQSEESKKLARKAAKLLARRARDHGSDAKSREEYQQQRTAAAYFCARTHMDLLGNDRKSEQWLRRAIELEPDFLYASVALIQLLFRQQRYQDAFEASLEAESAGQPRLRLFMDSTPLQACDVPLLLSKAIYYLYAEAPNVAGGGRAGSAGLSRRHADAWARRQELLESCERGCREHAGSTAAAKMADIAQLKSYWASAGEL